MAAIILPDDDLPTVPRACVRVASAGDENTYAHAQGGIWSAARALSDCTDEALVALMAEPEFYADCTPLERELIVRLKTRLELGRLALS